MLTGKQKRFLRAKAHSMQAMFQIGKDGIHYNLIEGLDVALDNHELIKVKLLESCPQTKNEVALEVSMHTKSQVVQIVGRTIVFYRSSDKKIYKLP